MKSGINSSNKIMKSIIFSFCTLIGICSIFFVNTMSVSAKTVKEITPETYTLTLQERGGIKEHIKGSDIGLKYNSETSKELIYDDGLLKQAMNKLSCFDSSKTVKSEDAKVIYNNNSYKLIKEVYGNEINKDVLYQNVVKSVKNGDTTINLESINCYKDPNYIEKSPVVKYAIEALNKYISSNITYNYAGISQTLHDYTIRDWIDIGQNFQITINEGKVRNYVDQMANYYTAALGKSIAVSGGYEGNNHSWIINSDAETKALISNIKNGQTITKNPIYSQTSAAWAFSNVGTNFVEIDMSKQHLWFYKDGYIVVDGDIVTGNLSNGNGTPEGVYNLRSKERNSVLIGPGYEAPVAFWMPFVNQIGLHDASWRSQFGGEIYKTDGSHGCVNLPYYVAEAIYNNIYPGYSVICHY